MDDFHHKVAVVTGAASGLGHALAQEAAARGMHLVLADIDADALEVAAKSFGEEGVSLLAQRCDVSDPVAVEALAQAAFARFGGVHLLFNNAGVGTGGLIWESALADWEWVLGVNLRGVIHGIRSFVPRMLAIGERDPRYRGHVVNSASVAGLLNAPNFGVYNVSKHAVVALSETLYQDLRLIDAPIGASVICPYFIRTRIDHAERTRPAHLMPVAQATPSQCVFQAMLEKSLAASRVSPRDVARMTFDAIGEQRFYVQSEPQMLGQVKMRMEDILMQRNPSDPYEASPQAREFLRANLLCKPEKK